MARWTAVAVFRILRNPVYIGTLVQGKRSTPNYKVKKLFDVPKEQWVSIPDSHEAIISKETFEGVAALLLADTRTAQGPIPLKYALSRQQALRPPMPYPGCCGCFYIPHGFYAQNRHNKYTVFPRGNYFSESYSAHSPRSIPIRKVGIHSPCLAQYVCLPRAVLPHPQTSLYFP